MALRQYARISKQLSYETHSYRKDIARPSRRGMRAGSARGSVEQAWLLYRAALGWEAGNWRAPAGTRVDVNGIDRCADSASVVYIQGTAHGGEAQARPVRKTRSTKGSL